MSESVILNDEIDDDYEPSDQEVEEYATYLGIQVNDERNLIWIAREGLKAPLPVNCESPDGSVYYFNFVTGESTWEHPMDDHYRAMVKKERQKSVAEKKLDAASAGSQTSTPKSSSGSLVNNPKSGSSAKPPLALTALRNAPLQPISTPESKTVAPLKPIIIGKKSAAALISDSPKPLSINQAPKLAPITKKVETKQVAEVKEVAEVRVAKVKEAVEEKVPDHASAKDNPSNKQFYVDPTGFDLYSSDDDDDEDEEIGNDEDILEKEVVSTASSSPILSSVSNSRASDSPEHMKISIDQTLMAIVKENVKDVNVEMSPKINDRNQHEKDQMEMDWNEKDQKEMDQKEMDHQNQIDPIISGQGGEKLRSMEEENLKLREYLAQLERRVNQLQNSSPKVTGPKVASPITVSEGIEDNVKAPLFTGHGEELNPMETFLKEMKARIERDEDMVKELRLKLKSDREQLVCANYGGSYEEITRLNNYGDDEIKGPTSDSEIISLQGEWLKSMDFHLKQSEKQAEDLRVKMNQDILTRRNGPSTYDIVRETQRSASLAFYQPNPNGIDEKGTLFRLQEEARSSSLPEKERFVAELPRAPHDNSVQQNKENQNNILSKNMSESAKSNGDFFQNVKEALKQLETFSVIKGSEIEKVEAPRSGNLKELTDELRNELEMEKGELEDARKFLETRPFQSASPISTSGVGSAGAFLSKFNYNSSKSPEHVVGVRSKNTILAQLQSELARGEEVLLSQSKFLREYTGGMVSNRSNSSNRSSFDSRYRLDPRP